MPSETPEGDTETAAQVESVLAGIAPIAVSQPRSAEERMTELMDSVQQETLKALDPLFRDTIEEFLPKRRRRLLTLLEKMQTTPKPATQAAPPSLPTPAVVFDRIATGARAPQTQPIRTAPEPVTQADMDRRVAELEDALDELSEKHIFQWHTLYRDWLSEDFDWFLDALDSYERYPQGSREDQQRVRCPLG